MPRFFVNNFETTLSGNITNVQTTIPLQAGDGALLPNITLDTPQDTDFLLTLDDGSNREVIRVIEHNGSDTLATVVRNYDGNGNFAFLSGDDVRMDVTADSMEEIWKNYSGQHAGIAARGSNNFEAQYGRSSNDHVNASDQSILIGGFSQIADNRNRSIVLGHFNQLEDDGSNSAAIAIGGSIGSMDSADFVLIADDPFLSSSGSLLNRGVYIGNSLQLGGDDSVVVGYDIDVDGDHAILIGTELGTFSGTDPMMRSIEIGWGWTNGAPNDSAFDHGGMVIGIGEELADNPIPGMSRITWPQCMGGSLELEEAGTIKPSYANNGTEVTLCLPRFNNTDATPFPPTTSVASYTWTLPADVFMFVEEVGFIFDTLSGGPASVVTDMVFDVGSSGAGSTDILNAQTVSVGVVPTVKTREVYASADSDTGFNAITLTLDTAAAYDTGNAFMYAYVRGILWKGN